MIINSQHLEETHPFHIQEVFSKARKELKEL